MNREIHACSSVEPKLIVVYNQYNASPCKLNWFNKFMIGLILIVFNVWPNLTPVKFHLCTICLNINKIWLIAGKVGHKLYKIFLP